MGKYDPPALEPGQSFLDKFVPGVVPSAPDPRDFLHLPGEDGVPPLAEIPAAASTPRRLPVRTQGRSDCMIFAAIACLEIEFAAAGISVDLSERFLSALYLEATGNLGRDVGSDPRSVMDLCVRVGALLEADWPYEVHLSETAGDDRKRLAQLMRGLSYVRAVDLQGVKSLIAQGHAVVVCFSLSTNFNPGSDGIMPRPDMTHPWGGHAMWCRAYDDNLYVAGYRRGTLTGPAGSPGVDTSWGAAFANAGGVSIPYDTFDLPDWSTGNDQGGAWKGDLFAFVGVSAQRQEVLPQPTPAPTPTPTPTPDPTPTPTPDPTPAPAPTFDDGMNAAIDEIMKVVAPIYIKKKFDATNAVLQERYNFALLLLEYVIYCIKRDVHQPGIPMDTQMEEPE